MSMAEMDHENDDNNNQRSKNIDGSLISLKGCREWLEQQKLDYETELNSMRKIEQEELEGQKEPSMEELCESILQLQKQLLEVSSTHSTRQYVLERLILSYVKMKKLFSQKSTEIEDPNQEELARQVDEELKLCKDFRKYQEALEDEQTTLRDLEKERFEVTRMNEKLWAELQELEADRKTNKTEKETKAESSLRKQILERQHMTEVARNICQALVFGSGVDWCEDKELTEMVLSLGTPIKLLDT